MIFLVVMVKVGVKISGYESYNPDFDLKYLLLKYKENTRRVSKVKDKGLDWKIVNETIFLNEIYCNVVKYISPFYYYHLYPRGFLGFIASDILAKSLDKRYGKPYLVYMERSDSSLKDYEYLIAKWIPRNVKLEKPLFIQDSGIVSGLRKIIEIKELEHHAYLFLKQYLELRQVSNNSPYLHEK